MRLRGEPMKKYKLTEETKNFCGIILYQLEALKDFADIKAGDKGGYIEKESNLSQYDDAWVYDNAWVYGDARVYDDALLYDNARVCGDARVCGNARVYDNNAVIQVGPIGSRYDFTTFFKNIDNGISVKCGCFYGTIEEFKAAVKKTHSGTKYEKEYMAAIEMAKAHIFGTQETACKKGRHSIYHYK